MLVGAFTYAYSNSLAPRATPSQTTYSILGNHICDLRQPTFRHPADDSAGLSWALRLNYLQVPGVPGSETAVVNSWYGPWESIVEIRRLKDDQARLKASPASCASLRFLLFAQRPSDCVPP
jgi:hypothetical protein